MPELEQELRALAAHLALPAERDLAPAVRAHLAAPRRRRFRLGGVWSRRLAIVAAVVVVAVGIAFAVPPARSAILRFLGLEGVSIVRVDKLPPAASGPVAFGRPVALKKAERQVGFRALLPDLGPPDAVHVEGGGRLLVLVYGQPRARLRLIELFDSLAFVQKMVGPDTRVESEVVNGGRAVWIEGEHLSNIYGLPRVSGSTLLWERPPLLLRLEGRLTKEEALRIARSTRAR
jgi:hypothetical protein